MKGLSFVAHSPQVKAVQWNERQATEKFKPRMVYFSVFPNQLENFAFLAADVNQENKITTQSHH